MSGIEHMGRTGGEPSVGPSALVVLTFLAVIIGLIIFIGHHVTVVP